MNTKIKENDTILIKDYDGGLILRKALRLYIPNHYSDDMYLEVYEEGNGCRYLTSYNIDRIKNNFKGLSYEEILDNYPELLI